MKVVLRHLVTGRYYSALGGWVRCAENALAFEDAALAVNFLRTRHLKNARPVSRLAPYLIPLIRARRPGLGKSVGELCSSRCSHRWYLEHVQRFQRN